MTKELPDSIYDAIHITWRREGEGVCITCVVNDAVRIIKQPSLGEANAELVVFVRGYITYMQELLAKVEGIAACEVKEEE